MAISEIIYYTFRVVAIDQRGYGGTSKPPNITDYSTALLAKDLDDLIHELGMFFLQIFIASYADKFKSEGTERFAPLNIMSLGILMSQFENRTEKSSNVKFELRSILFIQLLTGVECE